MTVWDGTRVQAAPTFAWGTRVANAPPNNSAPFSNFILDTRVRQRQRHPDEGRRQHTLKGGYYYFKSVQKRGTGQHHGSISFANDTNNPLDTSFGFANAALGVFSSYSQLSRWGEGAYTAINHEVFIQDNWKVSQRLTLDYGMRFVHQVPNYDAYMKVSNFFPDQWTTANAPRLYVSAATPASIRAPPPTGGRWIRGPASSSARPRRPASSSARSCPTPAPRRTAVRVAGDGHRRDTGFTYPTLGYAPRFGAAWDVKGDQSFVVRGGAGLFFDRPPANTIYGTVNNPPLLAERHRALRQAAGHRQLGPHDRGAAAS